MKRKHGFTLFETLVAIGVVALTLPVLFSIIFVLLRQYERTYAVIAAKSAGDNAITFFESAIRADAVAIYDNRVILNEPSVQICTKGQINRPYIIFGNVAGREPTMYFARKDGKRFGFTIEDSTDPGGGEVVMYTAADDNSRSLFADSEFEVTNVHFTCLIESNFVLPIVTFSFDLRLRANANSRDPVAPLHYRTQVRLRPH